MQILLAILLFAMWSLTFPMGKWLLMYSTPVFLTALRMLLSSCLLLIPLALFKRNALKFSKQQMLSILILSVFSIYLTNILEYYGLKHLSAAKTCFIYSLSPFFTAIFSFIHFKEKCTPSKALGILIGCLGFLPVFLSDSSTSFTELFSISLPELAVIGAALFSVYGWVILRLVVKNQNTNTFAANAVSMAIGGSIALIHSFFLDGISPYLQFSSHLLPLSTGIIAMTFLSNIVCYNLYGFLLKRFTATILSFFGLLSPIYASLTSYFLLNEPISPQILYSTAIILIGLGVVYRAELKQGYVRKEKEREEEAALLSSKIEL